MSSAWLSAAIEEFEQVTLENGTELFRVRARARQEDDPEPRPVLETRGQDGTSHTYEPMSSGGDRRGLMRLAYAVPTEQVGPSTAFSLRLPDGYRIELPEPTPGESVAEPEDGHPWPDADPAPVAGDGPEPDDGAARWIAELEHELGEQRSSNGELQRRLAEVAAARDQAGVAAARAHEELKSLRSLHAAVGEELRATRQSVAQTAGELERAHAERDAARRDAEAARAERDAALETSREQQAEHVRLTARLRQLEARNELLRADASGGRPAAGPRLRQLESEREQFATHVRALAELLSIDGTSGDVEVAAEPDGAIPESAVDPLETIRAHAVREANERAERELDQLRAGGSR